MRTAQPVIGSVVAKGALVLVAAVTFGASHSSMLCMPGMPKAKRAPLSSSARTTRSAPRVIRW